MKSAVPRLTNIVDEVMRDHEAGLLREKGPLDRRGKNPKRRPDTALIVEAMQRKQRKQRHK